uniref:Enoyl reductase (ER) domain-containing protein n=1 Tax=Panagrellus redivivus TaxID=6233 RepID=A0A7E4W1S4_PANRE
MKATLQRLNPNGGGSLMRAWVTEQYKTPLIQKQVAIPQISAPDHVLIKVKASSLNPIDTRMSEGYGHELMSAVTQLEKFSLSRIPRLPLITGRDAVGEVVATGQAVSNVIIGEDVIAVVPGNWPGAHAEYVLTKASAIARKPSNVDYVEAATLPYTACTAYSAFKTAFITPGKADGLRVLIHGGSGGMGSAAIQLLKAWNVEKVVATCSAGNIAYVNSLGGIGVDYNAPTVKDEIIAQGPFDFILSCVDTELSRWSDKIMGIWRNSVHVSVTTPLLKDIDRYGLPFGIASTAVKYLNRSACSAINGRWNTYAFFWPHQDCLEELTQLIEAGKIKIPNISKVYTFDEVPQGYADVGALHTKGKLVIDIAQERAAKPSPV